MPGIDLHTHSTASDGTLPPAELVALARRSGLEAVALTDHDTVAGLPEALAAGKKEGIEVVAGCELSVDSPKGFMHIVGLFLPENPGALIQGFEWLNQRRASRNTRIVDKLQALGLDVTYERVLEIAGDGTVGRPHIAKAIVECGAAPTLQEAFNRYIGDKGRAYLPKDKFSAEKGLEMLKDEGATTILAHPYTLTMEDDEFEAQVKTLKDAGLDGIEAHYTEHTRTMTQKYLELAKRFDLVVSGGSDFHGDIKPGIRLGRGKGGLFVPYEILEAIKEHRAFRGLPS